MTGTIDADTECYTIDIERVLGTLDRMSAQRPVAAQIVTVTNNESAGAKDLARILGADVALTAKVSKLANSAYYGVSGKVKSLQFAVTVVGFSTVRAMATVALTGMDDATRLPDDFWDTSTHIAMACSVLAPVFGEKSPDALCLGLLAQMGTALLFQNDPFGYSALAAGSDLGPARSRAEALRYGITSTRLTAAALQQWKFSTEMVESLVAVDDDGYQGSLLRVAYELAARLTNPEHTPTKVELLCKGRITEAALQPHIAKIKAEVKQLKEAFV